MTVIDSTPTGTSGAQSPGVLVWVGLWFDHEESRSSWKRRPAHFAFLLSYYAKQ